MILIDTHVWVWFVTGDKRLKDQDQKLLEKKIKENQVGVSLISLWEIAWKVSNKKINLSSSTETWILDATLHSGIHVLPLTESIVIKSTSLPGDFHKDPADRFIVATAREMRSKLLTYDALILKYAKGGWLELV